MVVCVAGLNVARVDEHPRRCEGDVAGLDAALRRVWRLCGPMARAKVEVCNLMMGVSDMLGRYGGNQE